MASTLREHTVLLTGATGFVGGALMRHLLASGISPMRLRCLVRDRSRAQRSGVPSESVVLGDLCDLEALRAAVLGVDVVFHVAGQVRAVHDLEFDEVNRGGVERLVAAIGSDSPSARVVLVSSLAAAGPSVDGSGSNDPASRCRPVSRYGESKRQGELVLAASGLVHATIRPPLVYGPGDAATRLLLRQATGLMCPVPLRSRPLSVVHVDDVVAAVLATATTLCDDDACPGILGEAMAVEGPERTDTHALLRAMARAAGVRARLLPLPLGLVHAAACVADLASRCSGRPWFFSRDKVRELAAPGWVGDAAKAQQLLGWAPARSLTTSLGEVVARQQG